MAYIYSVCAGHQRSHTDTRAVNNLGVIEKHIEFPSNKQIIRLASGSIVSSKKIRRNIKHKVGVRIKNARKKCKISISELARRVNVKHDCIRRIEKGENFPHIQTLRKIAQILDCPIWYLGYLEILPENTLGQKIKKARLYYGLTSPEFAQMINADEFELAKWENDKRFPRKRISKINELLKILNTH
jgi:ribosome-binding protein aMBF1 (putative translation factor)